MQTHSLYNNNIKEYNRRRVKVDIVKGKNTPVSRMDQR